MVDSDFLSDWITRDDTLNSPAATGLVEDVKSNLTRLIGRSRHAVDVDNVGPAPIDSRFGDDSLDLRPISALICLLQFPDIPNEDRNPGAKECCASHSAKDHF